MITQEEFDEMKQMMKWYQADAGQAGRIGHYYAKLINPHFNFCATCPTNVSFAFGAVKEWFAVNKDAIEKQLIEVELIKAKANEQKTDSVPANGTNGKGKNKRAGSK